MASNHYILILSRELLRSLEDGQPSNQVTRKRAV